MAILATNTGTTRELTPAGNYIARCYSMIQIGTITDNIQGVEKTLHKVRIGWEFPLELKVFNEEKGEQPLVHSEEYTLSMHEKSNLRKMLASWRGRDFTADEAKSFDITALLGKACMVNIIHAPSKSDPTKIYANIGSVSSIPKGMDVPEQINLTFELSYDNFSWDKFNTLPDFIKEKMKRSIEFAALTTPTSAQMAATHADGLPAPKRTATGNVMIVEAIDDLPF